MIKKYLEFINESFELILESDIVYSDKFRLALNKIDNPISKSLLGIEHKDIDVRSNFFDIKMDKNDTISFTPDRRAQQILNGEKEKVNFVGNGGGWLTFNKNENGEYKNKKLFDALEFVPSDELIKPERGDIGEVIKKTVSEKSGKTFALVKFPNTELVINVNKLRVVDDRMDKVWATNRQEIRVGRAIRALLKSGEIEVVDKDIEDFVNKYKATIDKFNDKFSYFKEVKGDEISFWYDYDNYYNGRGTLGSSCMAKVSSDFFEIYVENPDVCSLIILKSDEDESKIIGRSLLWKLRDGKKLMDRIYTNNDSDIQLFRDWAKENGWHVKQYNNSTASSSCVSPDGENVNLDVIVDIKPGEYDYYPYLDTLKYFDTDGTLSVNQTRSSYTLEDTYGGHYTCEYCDNGRTTCYYCDGDGEWECSDCDGSAVEDCGGCDGTGLEDGEECPECGGDSNLPCSGCDGDGTITCDSCGGDGRVDCYECT